MGERQAGLLQRPARLRHQKGRAVPFVHTHLGGQHPGADRIGIGISHRQCGRVPFFLPRARADRHGQGEGLNVCRAQGNVRKIFMLRARRRCLGRQTRTYHKAEGFCAYDERAERSALSAL